LKVTLQHRLTYSYPEKVALGPHLVRLRPAAHSRTQTSGYSLLVDPASEVYWQQDPAGNFVARCLFAGPADRLDISVSLVADIAMGNPFNFLVAPEAETWPFVYSDAEKLDLQPYLVTDVPEAPLNAFLAGISREFRETVGFLVELNRRLREQVDYLEREEEGTHEPSETLTRGEGSCRDSGWLLVAVLRHLGLAARFVSGYLAEIAEHGGQDRASLHAWAEVYVPGAGWVGLDPSSGLLAGAGHIPLAATRHWKQAAAVSGTSSGTDSSLDFEMEIVRTLGGEDPE
jgi:transglutaminase-like putative cysteine protease